MSLAQQDRALLPRAQAHPTGHPGGSGGAAPWPAHSLPGAPQCDDHTGPKLKAPMPPVEGGPWCTWPHSLGARLGKSARPCPAEPAHLAASAVRAGWAPAAAGRGGAAARWEVAGRRGCEVTCTRLQGTAGARMRAVVQGRPALQGKTQTVPAPTWPNSREKIGRLQQAGRGEGRALGRRLTLWRGRCGLRQGLGVQEVQGSLAPPGPALRVCSTRLLGAPALPAGQPPSLLAELLLPGSGGGRLLDGSRPCFLLLSTRILPPLRD